MNSEKNIRHLFARASFGMRFQDWKKYRRMSIRDCVTQLFNASHAIKPLDGIVENIDLWPRPEKPTDEEKKALQVARKEQYRTLNYGWIKKLNDSDAQLREKMTLFWSNHFSCSNGNSLYLQQLNNIERANALGNFKTLLIEVSKSPAMLQYLSNQQNRKDHPNENFARELMELFTLGRGHYTEDDIKESARAFTGWAFDPKTGRFLFRANQHDTGSKTFMGNTGNYTGEDIINIIMANKQTAVYICSKLYRYLVNDIIDEANVNRIADIFYKGNYEIKPVIEYIFMSGWFYESKNVGNLIKSPIELLTGITRQFFVSYASADVPISFQRALGQTLFRPPNVAGWPVGRNWIDSSLLMYRLKVPSIMLNGGVLDFTGKVNPEDEAYLAIMQKQQLNQAQKVEVVPNWNSFLRTVPTTLSKHEIAAFLLEPQISKELSADLSRSKDTKTTIIQIVSTPEYQLC